jgi:hypothetical protein
MIIETHPKCGTHIHMPPLQDIWLLLNLKKICHSVLWFEGAFEVLVPESRRRNHHCKSNRFDNERFGNKTEKHCLAMIDKCKSNHDVVDLMNDGGNRYFAWNFSNLYYGGKMTIEFRRAPGVEDSGGCLAWVEFAVSFVQAAITLGSTGGLEQYNRGTKGLLKFILNASQQLNRPQAMKQIFSNKRGSMIPGKIGGLTAEQGAVLEQKKRAGPKEELDAEEIPCSWNVSTSQRDSRVGHCISVHCNSIRNIRIDRPY